MSWIENTQYNQDGSSYPVYTDYGGGGTQWAGWQAINTGLQSAAGILGARYAVPQLNNGQIIQTGPNGTYMSQNAGGGIPNLLGGGAGGSSSLLLLGSAALVVIMMMGRKN